MILGSFNVEVTTVLGDWSRAGLRVVSTVETTDETTLSTAYCGRRGAPLNDALPSGTPTVQPRSREVLFDPRLLFPESQPPRSWSAANVPAPHAAGAPSGTPAGQQHAMGGTVALRLVAPTEAPFTRMDTRGAGDRGTQAFAGSWWEIGELWGLMG